MNFIFVMRALEERLGYHQVPLNPAARDLKGLFETGPLHHDLMTRAARAIYAGNGCRRLVDPVERQATFVALQLIRGQALRAPATDVDAFRLLEDLGEALRAVFLTPDPPATARARRHEPARVIPFTPVRRGRLTSSA